MTRGQLPKAYLRLDPDIDQRHPENLDAFVRLLCAANRQKPRGYFRGRAVVDALFGKTLCDRFLARADLTPQPDGRLYMEGWREWQEGDLTVADRMSRLRSKPVTQPSIPRNTDVTEPLSDRSTTSEASRRLGSKALSPSNEGAPHRPLTEHQKTIAWLTGKEISGPSGWAIKGLQALAKGYGSDRVIASFEEGLSAGRKTANGLVKYAEAELEPFASAAPKRSAPKGFQPGAEERDSAFVRE